MIRAFLICLAISASTGAFAQLRYGFKTGLNFSRIAGPSETDQAGNDLEQWKSETGFQIGVTLKYAFSDVFSVRSEVLYAKKGGLYTFDGPSYRYFRDAQANTLTFGRSQYALKVNNSYIDIPVMAAARWKRLEVAGGVYGAIMVQSIAEGSLRYTGGRTSGLNNSIDSIYHALNYKYRRDVPGGANDSENFDVRVDSRDVNLPKTLGAYFDYTEDKGPLYRPFDVGLIGELSFYLSHSLYLSGRMQYGLTDLTRNQADLSKTEVNADGSLRFRDDKDRNLTIQVTLGFSF